MQTERNPAGFQARTTSYDVGLRSYFQKIYNIMAFGLVVTGLIAYGVSQSPMAMGLFFGNPIIRFVVIFSPLAMVWFGFSAARFNSLNSKQLTLMFVAYAMMLGVSLSTIFMIYGGQGIARAFFITAGAFAGTSIFGYTTKKDLTGMGSLMFMGFWGVFLASIANYFMHSAPLQYAISIVSVIVFTGLIAWETQNLKRMYSASSTAEVNNKLAVWGALQLYISFINLFLAILRLSGNRR